MACMDHAPPTEPGSLYPVKEPHRGSAVLVMGILSLVINGCAIGWILGIVAWVMGASDLKKMKAGRMDPAGEGNTKAGMICGIISVAFFALAAIGYTLFIILFGAIALAGAASGAGP